MDLALVLALACLLAMLTWVIFMPAATAAERNATREAGARVESLSADGRLLGPTCPCEDRRWGDRGLAGPPNLVHRRQILVGVVLIGRQEALVACIQQRHRGFRALLDLPHQLQILEG